MCKLRLPVGDDEQRVFRADAVAPCTVDARFVGHGHARTERSGHMVHAYLVRAFVYVQISSHAVSRPVQEVGPFAPHCLAGQHVELCAAGALGKAGHGSGRCVL